MKYTIALLSLWLLACGAPLAETDGASRDASASSDAAADAVTESSVVDVATQDAATLPMEPCGTLALARIVRAQFSPSATRIAVAMRSSSIAILAATDGVQLQQIETPHVLVYDAAFSPDERTLISYGSDGYLRAWDLQTGALRWATRRAMPAEARLLVHGDSVFVGGLPAERYSLRDGSLLGTYAIESSRSGIGVIAVSPDGMLVLAGAGPELREFYLDGRPTGKSFSPDLGIVHAGAYPVTVQSAEYSPDGSMVLVGSSRSYVVTSAMQYPTARLFRHEDASTFSTFYSSSPYTGRAVFVRETTDTQRVVVLTSTGAELVTVRDARGWIETPTERRSLTTGVSQVIAGASGALLFQLGELGLRGWTIGNSTANFDRSAGDSLGRTLAFGSNGTLVRLTAGTGTLERWSLRSRTPQLLSTIPNVGQIADLSPDGTMIAIARSPSVEVRTVTGTIVRTIATRAASIGALAFSQDGQSLLVAEVPTNTMPSSLLTQWGMSGDLLAQSMAGCPVEQIRRSVTGNTWITIGPSRDHYRGPNSVELWSQDRSLRTLLSRRLEGAGRDTADLSADGSTLLLASLFAPVQALRPSDGATLPLSMPPTYSRFSYSPDGRLLAIADQSGQLGFTTPERPTQANMLMTNCDSNCRSNRGSAVRLQFSPDSRVLAVALNTGALQLYCRREE